MADVVALGIRLCCVRLTACRQLKRGHLRVLEIAERCDPPLLRQVQPLLNMVTVVFQPNRVPRTC